MKPKFFTKKYISLIILTVLLLPLISPLSFAVSAHQLGASKIYGWGCSANWAGVFYSDEYPPCFYFPWCKVFAHWSPILFTMEKIYVENLTLRYAGVTDPNEVGIWIALSPCKMGTFGDSISDIISNFVQAGYGIFVYPNNTIKIQYFAQIYKNGQLYGSCEGFVPPRGDYKSLNIFMSLFCGKSVCILLLVCYTNGKYWSISLQADWLWNNTAYTTMSIIEAPETPCGYFLELPIICGGMICYSFIYKYYNNNTFPGPYCCPAPNTRLWAFVSNLSIASHYNYAKAKPINGWWGWHFVYQFCYPWLGIKTTGL